MLLTLVSVYVALVITVAHFALPMYKEREKAGKQPFRLYAMIIGPFVTAPLGLILWIRWIWEAYRFAKRKI